jgi:GGDEF domain-containing protein
MPQRVGDDLDASLTRRRAQCRRVRSPLALLQLQLMDLAQWEQRLGAAPVRGLCGELGQRLKHRVRDTDEVLLLGDGRYAVLLPGAAPAEAAVVEARLREALAAPYRIGPLLLAPRLAVTQQHWSATDDAVSAAVEEIG